jgi:hypothetical protein
MRAVGLIAGVISLGSQDFTLVPAEVKRRK